MSEMNFDDLETTYDDSNDYDFDNWETLELDDAGAAVVGRLEAVIENIGQYDSTAYLIEVSSEDNEDVRRVMVWGNASINAGFENAEASEGDMLGIRNTGETYENEYGEYPEYEVRYSVVDDE